MDLRSKLSLHKRLFIFLLAFSWILLACFVTFQYGREKQFKAERLDAQLQQLNTHLLDALDNGVDPATAAATQRTRFADLRITVIDLDGRVRYDSAESADSVRLLPNHLQRPEVAAALKHGTGYTTRRLSESTHTQYFYSAMRGNHAIVRTAIPYTMPLHEVLTADRGFLWFMLSITLIMSVVAYLFTRRLGHNITRLRDFAECAEQGREMSDNPSFPHDELGEISAHIVRLYAQLHKTTVDRDREHALALFEEKEKIRIKKQLTNNINHELKTPVAVIKGYLETILANPDMEAAQRTTFIEKSNAQTERLSNLLADVAIITRMDEASLLIGKEQIVVNHIIDELQADIQLLPAERRMRLHCDFTHPVIIEGNAALIGSIFHNLTDNATAYSMGRDLYIRLLREDETHYTFLFADNGIGIEEEHLPRIFERFYRVDKGRSRKVGGTGLGLAIVKNAVVLHGGEIEARNSDRGGLEFIFTLCKKA
ncbi:MAG: ATP-binding protein [Alistipes sp.]